MEGLSESDMYVAQLKEVFDSCDKSGTGFLNQDELITLCQKLQLEDQTETLISHLISEERDVEFEEFKEVFVRVLCQSDDETTYTEDDPEDQSEQNTSQDEAMDHEVSPKYVKGQKKYGRRSKPYDPEDFEYDLDDEDDGEPGQYSAAHSGRLPAKHPNRSGSSESEQGEDGGVRTKKRRRDHQASSDEDERETFEAEGQMNLAMADMENAPDTQTEAEYLRTIWKRLGVGSHGFLTITELARVCQHIGMEEMDEEELQQLFDKLDSDGDSLVSFDEFLEGLFQHNTPTANSATPRSFGTPTPRSLSAQKKIKLPASNTTEGRMTPSIVPGSGASGLFTALDPDRTGFAKAEEIIDLWDNYNVGNGADILLALGFDLNTKVNLSELSFMLEQELINADDQSAVYQAAFASYQQEIRHLKSSMEQLTWAGDKLKQDLSEANTRNSMLAKEVDERHASMERSAENRLLTVEKKYQEQIKTLQTDLEQEREQCTTMAAKHKQILDTEMEALKQEEAKLRENLVQAQKEMEKLESDLFETTEKLTETERQNTRLQRELSSTDDLHRKLQEYESTGALLSHEEQKNMRQRLERVELENKELKDRNDELTTEVENLKQASPRQKRPSRQVPDMTRIPIREGAVLPDSVRTRGSRKSSSFSSADNSEDDDAASLSGFPTHGSRTRRRLPEPPGQDDDACSVSSIQSVDKDLVEQLKKELADLKANFERERKEIEQGYKVEISQVEDTHYKEKEDLLQSFGEEKKKLLEEHERLKQEVLAELERSLQTSFVHEKEGLIQKHESETAQLLQREREGFIQKHESETTQLLQRTEKEKQELEKRLRKDFQEHLDSQLSQLRATYDEDRAQLEAALSKADAALCDFEHDKAALEQRLQLQKEELEAQFNSDKEHIHEQFEAYVDDLEAKHKQNESADLQQRLQLQKEELETRFNSEKESLQAQFDAYVDELEETNRQQNQNDLELRLEEQKQELESYFNEEKDQLQKHFDAYVDDLEEKHRQNERADVEQRLQMQREELESHFNSEKEQLQQQFDVCICDLEEKHAQKIAEYDSLRFEGVDALSGQTREDFFRLLEEYKEEALAAEKATMFKNQQQQTFGLEETFKTEKAKLYEQFEHEKQELETRYQQQINVLQEQLEDLGRRLEEQKAAMLEKISSESDQQSLEDSLVQSIRDELEDEFIQQMEEVKDAFEDEKREYEAQNRLLQEEVDELQKALETEQLYRRKVDELNKMVTRLQREKFENERAKQEAQDKLQSTKTSLERRIDELLSEKDQEITAAKTEAVQAEKQNNRDKETLESVTRQKSALEAQVSSLTQQVAALKQEVELAHSLQTSLDKETKQKTELSNEVQKLAAELERLKSGVKETPKQVNVEQFRVEKQQLEEQLLGAQQRLAEADDTKHTLAQLQEEYNRVCTDKKELQHSVGSLQDRLQKTSILAVELETEKDKLKAIQFEKQRLENELQNVSEKLKEASAALAKSQSNHFIELQSWRDKTNTMVDLQNFTQLQVDLVDQQRILRELQETMDAKENELNHKFKGTEEGQKNKIQQLEDEKQELLRKLKILQELLDEQVDKLKKQFSESEKRNLLVVDLYKENAELMEALYGMEERQKDAVSRCYKLEDQCNALRIMLKQVCHVAVT